MNAEQIVRNTIEEHGLIRGGDRVILGLSGGPDSLCLLHILAGLQDELSFSLSCVHVNHLMRGDKATEDVEWLSEHCRSMYIPLVISVCDVYKKAEDEGISVEEAGRKARHSALFRQAAALSSMCNVVNGGRTLVALAHNRDDQAETVLMRMLRGTGVHGLSAMEYERPDGLIRPLLDVPRAKIEAYCKGLSVTPRFDSTNASRDYLRNRLRLDLIPMLEQEYNPGLKQSLARLSNNAREDDSFLNELAREAIGQGAFVESGRARMELQMLKDMKPAIFKRVIRLLFWDIGLKQDIASPHLNALLGAVNNKRQGAVIEFPQGYKARIVYESLELYRQSPVDDEAACSRDMLPMAYILKSRVLPMDEAPSYRELPTNQRLFDLERVEALGAEVTLRYRLPGDRITPLGMKGSKKLKDWFVDEKVDRELRGSTPIVCCGSTVIWILNGPVSELCKVTQNTKAVLLLEIDKNLC